jgi:predicted MFS family arabinose efflux permease
MGPAEGLATTATTATATAGAATANAATATATTATAATAERVARPGAVALRLATGAGLVVAGLSARSVLVAVPAVLAGAVLAVPAARRLLPPGTAVARPGLPAAVATRGLVAFAFFGTEAFLTLALTTVRRRSAAEAGLVLTSSTLSWATGSWGQARLAGRWPRQRVAVVGIAVVVAGLAGVSSVLFEAVTIPVAVAAACWAVTGFGMGLAYPTTTLAMLAEAAPGREGSASSALQLADVLGVALGTGLGGAAVALFLSLGQTRRVGIAVAFSLCLGAAGLSLLSARRLGGVREAADDDAGAEMALPGGSTAVRLGG